MTDQTAIQELFEKYGHLLPDVKKKYLEKEKQQIEEDFYQGYNKDVEDIEDDESWHYEARKLAELYYIQKYKQLKDKS